MDIDLDTCKQAVATFKKLANTDLAALSNVLQPYLIDGLENGKAQKFEYTLELIWKSIKQFLKYHEGIDEASPKRVIKSFYLSGYLDELNYLQLMQAIDDRNKLSHIYAQIEFDKILTRLPEYADLFERVLGGVIKYYNN